MLCLVPCPEIFDPFLIATLHCILYPISKFVFLLWLSTWICQNCLLYVFNRFVAFYWTKMSKTIKFPEKIPFLSFFSGLAFFTGDSLVSSSAFRFFCSSGFFFFGAGWASSSSSSSWILYHYRSLFAFIQWLVSRVVQSHFILETNYEKNFSDFFAGISW